MLLARDKSQLLMVDMQEKLFAAIDEQERVLEHCLKLVQAAKTLRLPITVSEQYPNGLGHTVEPLRQALGNGAALVEKLEFSCLKNDLLRERLHELRRQGRSQVVIGGIEAHVCVTQTAIDLEEQGFEAFVVVDAVGSRAKGSKRLAVMRLLKDSVDVVDTEMVLFEWLERAGTPEFKELQKLVR